MKFRLISVFWGEPFRELFDTLCLRSLFGGDNLVEFAKKYECAFTIHTTREDASELQNSIWFQRLGNTVPLDISLLDAEKPLVPSGSLQSELWEKCLDDAKSKNEIVIWIIPDLLYASGTLLRWGKIFENGFRAIYTPGPFVALETARIELHSLFPDSTRSIELSIEDLQPFLSRHLHPIEAAMFRDAPRRAQHPEHDLRAVGNAGFIMRTFASQPFCIDPNAFSLLRSLNVDTPSDLIYTAPCSTLSFEPILKTAEWLYRPLKMDGVEITKLASWWDAYAFRGNLYESEKVYDFSLSSARTDIDAELHRQTIEGCFYRTQVLIGMTLFRIVNWCSQRGEIWPAAFLASASACLPLRRYIGARGNIRVFIPRNAPFSKTNNYWVWDLLKPENRQALIQFVRAHIFDAQPGRCAHGTGTPANNIGVKDMGKLTHDADGPYPLDGIDVYLTDDFLIRPEIAREASNGFANKRAGASFIRKSRKWMTRIQWTISIAHRKIPLSPRQLIMCFHRLTLDQDTKKSCEMFRKLQILEGLESALKHYESVALPASSSSEPLILVRDQYTRLLKSRHWLGLSPQMRLETIGEKYPWFCECWLELGFVYLDLGKKERALQAFEKAYAGIPYLIISSATPDPRGIALVEAAKLHASLGSYNLAEKILCRSLYFGGDSAGARTALATVRLANGDVQKAALDYLDSWQPTKMNYPTSIKYRDISDLTSSATTK